MDNPKDILVADVDIDRVIFPARLLEILEAISEADFVAIDCELSGIAERKFSSGKPLLQERYAEIKEAAECYTILQMGLTCVREDRCKMIYTSRPYNFNICPLILAEKLDLDRTWSFQSSAATFLLKNSFKIEAPFTSGIGYLSRLEAKQAEENVKRRLNNRSEVEDVRLTDKDVDSLKFMEKVRKNIAQWEAHGKPHSGFLIVNSRTEEDTTYPQLSNFEKRLVHQLVRNEFPHLTTIGNPSYVKVERYDAIKEKNFKEEIMKKRRKQILGGSGFRWIIEALIVDGDISTLDPLSLGLDRNTGRPKVFDACDLRNRLNRVRENLKLRRPVLVGHNLFQDLIYTYKTFIGDLPASVEDFRKCIIELFPRVVDTKYLATHNCSDITPQSQLKDLYESLRWQSPPNIETLLGHQKYERMEALHEAGYDAYITADIMVRLSVKTEALGAYVIANTSLPPSPASSESQEYHDALEGFLDERNEDSRLVGYDQSYGTEVQEQLGRDLAHGSEAQTPKKKGPDGGIEVQAFSKEHGATADQADEAIELQAAAATKKKRKTKRKNRGSTANTEGDTNSAITGRFSSRNIYDSLTNMYLGRSAACSNSTNEVLTDVTNSPNRTPTLRGGSGGDGGNDTQAAGLMPRFDSPFWKVYGNRLRIFGTQESLLQLGDWPETL